MGRGGEWRCVQVLLGKLERRRPLGRPRHGWEDNIKMDLRGVGYGTGTGSILLRIGTGNELL